MGLDMYLYRLRKTDVQRLLHGELEESGIEEEAYWRKANQIHYYFDDVFDGVKNCGYYVVDKEVLEELLSFCKKVHTDEYKYVVEKTDVKTIANKPERTFLNNGALYVKENGDTFAEYSAVKVISTIDLAKELLPVCDGFYFGDTSYGESYMSDIDFTINIIEEILRDTDFENEVIVYWAWW